VFEEIAIRAETDDMAVRPEQPARHCKTAWPVTPGSGRPEYKKGEIHEKQQ
jgi:hypothetical protein